MSTFDPTQLPPAGTALAGAPAVSADAGETPAAGDQPQVSSVQKVAVAIEQLAAAKGPAVQAFLTPILSQVNLPAEADQLDQLLLEGATTLISLRSDGTLPLGIYPPPQASAATPAIATAVAGVRAALAALEGVVTGT